MSGLRIYHFPLAPGETLKGLHGLIEQILLTARLRRPALNE